MTEQTLTSKLDIDYQPSSTSLAMTLAPFINVLYHLFPSLNAVWTEGKVSLMVSKFNSSEGNRELTGNKGKILQHSPVFDLFK